MKETRWSENVILVDADYVDKVAFNLIVNFERMLNRRIQQADMARWLECVALDGGLRPRPGQPETVQVVLLHRQPQMGNFQPGRHEGQLDGQAFGSELGEFLISSVAVEDMVTTADLFTDSMEVICNSADTRRIVLVPGEAYIYNKVRASLQHADPDKHITVLAMEPVAGGPFRQEILGYSLMAALGIRGEELDPSRSPQGGGGTAADLMTPETTKESITS